MVEIKIIKSSFEEFWYSKYINETYISHSESSIDYYVKNEFGDTMAILKSDVEVIKK